MHPSDLNGPGKYDDITTLVREVTEAQGVAVIVVGGNKGQGFSVQGSDRFIERLPDVLEDMARSIRAQAQAASPAAEQTVYVDCGECPRISTGCKDRCAKADRIEP
jgi:hypothetical protein